MHIIMLPFKIILIRTFSPENAPIKNKIKVVLAYQNKIIKNLSVQKTLRTALQTHT